MPQHYSFKTEVAEGETCFCLANDKENWLVGNCTSITAYLSEEVKLIYMCNIDSDQGKLLMCKSDQIASRDSFLEWQSRLIDCAKDQFKFKGNIEKMFGPESYSNWIPFYKEDISPSNAYLQGMGLVDFGGEEEV